MELFEYLIIWRMLFEGTTRGVTSRFISFICYSNLHSEVGYRCLSFSIFMTKRIEQCTIQSLWATEFLDCYRSFRRFYCLDKCLRLPIAWRTSLKTDKFFYFKLFRSNSTIQHKILIGKTFVKFSIYDIYKMKFVGSNSLKKLSFSLIMHMVDTSQRNE